MKDSEVLAQARALIDTPEKWIKGTWKCPKGTRKRDFTTATVDQYCIEGAVQQVLGRFAPFYRVETGDLIDQDHPWTTNHVQFNRVMDFLRPIVFEMRPSENIPADAQAFNDSSFVFHEDVMALCDKGIAALQEQGR